MSDTAPGRLRLKHNEERRLRAGHPWVYSNEVDIATTPLKTLVPGSEVLVEDSHGKVLGRALASPAALICARLFTRKPDQTLSNSLLKKRLSTAVALRDRVFGHNSYRAVFGEADGLPGLVIDRYGDCFVMQCNTPGMDALQQRIAELLQGLFGATAVIARNTSAVRELEGLECGTHVLLGDMPDQVSVHENGLDFCAPLAEGQKTGWFYDHRSARQRIRPLAADARVLDVFSYCGAWGVLAATWGAKDVTCIDSSALALEYLEKNAHINDVDKQVRGLRGDAQALMKELATAGEKYDLVILDPPAFIKRRKDFRNGLAGYHSINELAMRLVAPGGFLVSASCSMALPAKGLLDVIHSSARHIDRQLQVLAYEGQAEDHPMHPAIPETAYLKTWFCRVLSSN